MHVTTVHVNNEWCTWVPFVCRAAVCEQSHTSGSSNGKDTRGTTLKYVNQPLQESGEPSCRKSYTVTFKRQVKRKAKLTTQRSAARRFDVSAKQVRSWIRDEDKQLGYCRTRRMVGAGRKPASEELDEELLQ
jgi:hypothetical protein